MRSFKVAINLALLGLIFTTCLLNVQSCRNYIEEIKFRKSSAFLLDSLKENRITLQTILRNYMSDFTFINGEFKVKSDVLKNIENQIVSIWHEINKLEQQGFNATVQINQLNELLLQYSKLANEQLAASRSLDINAAKQSLDSLRSILSALDNEHQELKLTKLELVSKCK